jgi:predicted nucleic acid-binding protein
MAECGRTNIEIDELLGPERAVRAATNYRKLRRLGATVRKTTDIIIGTWCIDTGTALLYSDRDFEPMASHLGLQPAL